MTEESFKEKKEKFLKNFEFLKNKKFQLAITIILFLIILYTSFSLRLQNLDSLKDATTGKYISTDLDSLYFYREAETQLELGHLPPVDKLRSPGQEIGWVKELIDNALILNYKVLGFLIKGISFDYASVLFGPILYSLILITFFLMFLLLTKSKITSLIASAFLAYSPLFIFRSSAGFYDHDPLGVFAILLLIIAVYFALKSFEKDYKRSSLLGLIIGFFVSLVFVSWGGGITFVLVFLPITYLFYYLFNCENKNKFIIHYGIILISSIIFTAILGGNSSAMYNKFLDSQGILMIFVLGYALIEKLFYLINKKFNIINEKQEKLICFISTLIIGGLGLILSGKNPINLIRKAWATLIYPFFGEFGSRLETTVAENSQPYLIDLIKQLGNVIFLFFVVGLIFLALEIYKNCKSKKEKILGFFSTLILFLSILFSRYSEKGILNGENFFSQGVYLLGCLIFFISLGYILYKKSFKIENESILFLAIAITTIINARAASRSFFLITPFIVGISSKGISNVVKILKNSKDDLISSIKFLIIIILGITIFLVLFGNPLTNSPGNYQISSYSAKYTGPSANIQWQNAMAWVRNNTDENDIFIHWWDYGYFIQTLADRPTVTDGGHSGGSQTDHYIGRYLLTTPNTKTALSYMKTWNVSYLLIDPTDLGKYGAYSKIGSNDSWDRVSTGIFGGEIDDSLTQETSYGKKEFYLLNNCVDEDIIYTDKENKTIFLPGISVTKTQQLVCNSYIIGVILDLEFKNRNISYNQPIGIYYSNGKQYFIPLKNIFIDGKMNSYTEGINSVVYLIPRVNKDTQKIELHHAIIYLSPRTFNSLVGKLYILNDYYNEYPTIKKANFENDPIVDLLKKVTGNELNEFIWYQGIRAPLKIWKVEYPEGTPTYEELLGYEYFLKNGFGGADKIFK
jgi:dolichyl-diphosphooligosaccharide--protein glycosyltransferase